MTDLFLKLVSMSITASWLALAVIVLRLLLKKAPKWLNLILWGLVGLRLVLPFSIQSALSLIPSAKIRPELLSAQGPAASGGAPALSGAAAPAVSEAVLPTVPATDIIVPNPLAPDTAAAAADPMQTWLFIAAVIWAIGAAAMLAYALVSYLRISRRVKTAVRLRDNIYQSEHAVFPFVLGVFRPRIYLPFRMSDKDMAYVIAHEQTHIKRKDHWTKPIGFLLLALYWFNPVLWAAYLLFCRDIEFACDEQVVKELSEEQRADYSQALLVCSVPRRTLAACPLAFGEIGVKKRVKHILDYKKPSFWLIAAAVIVCIAAAVCFLTDPYSAQTEEEDGTPPVESTEEVPEPMDEVPESAETVDALKLAGMIPSSAGLCGQYQGYLPNLYVPLGENIYRYQLAEAVAPADLVKGELLHVFTSDEITVNETRGVGWEVYAVEGDPDYSRVLVYSELVLHLYEYDPPQGISPDVLEQAKENGCVIVQHYDTIYGQQVWLDFLKATEEGKRASIQVGYYSALSPGAFGNLYMIYKEDYPQFYTNDLTYDGNRYTLRLSDGEERIYQYLLCYTGEDYEGPYANYVLTDDNTIATYEELFTVYPFDTPGAYLLFNYAGAGDNEVTLSSDVYAPPQSAHYQSAYSWVGYSEDGYAAIVERAENRDAPRRYENSDHLMPLVKLDSKADFDGFYTEMSAYFDFTQAYDDTPAFSEQVEDYTADFFEEYSLFIAYITESSVLYRHAVEAVYFENGSMDIRIHRTETGDDHTMAGWFMAVAVPKADIAGCASFDSYVIRISDSGYLSGDRIRTYRFTEDGSISYLSLYEGDKFQLVSYSPHASSVLGTYAVEDDRLTLSTRNGELLYVFDMVDDTLVFDADSSFVSERSGVMMIADGSVFK